DAAAYRDIAPVEPSFELRSAFWGADGFLYYTNAPATGDAGQAPGLFRLPSTGGSQQLVLKSKSTPRGATVYLGQQLLRGPRPALLYSTNIGPLRRSTE